MNENLRQRDAGIDLLRGFSVFLVVLSHYGFLKGFVLGGTHGVAIFFMVSGYCMSYSTRNRTGGQFLAARLWRLVPTLIVCATITAAIELAFADVRPDRAQTVKDYLANLGCLPNGNLLCDIAYDISRGHPISYNWVDGAYWSLLVEIRFYLLLWGLFYLLRQKHVAFWIATLGLLAPLNLDSAWISNGRDFLLYLSFFAFGLGYRGWTAGAKGGGAIAVYSFLVFLSNCGLGSVGVSMSLTSENGLSYALCFLIFLACVRLFRNVRNRIVSFFGVISYPLYLLHQDIGYILIGIVDARIPGLGASAAVAAVVLMAAAVSFIIERYQPALIRRVSSYTFPGLSTRRSSRDADPP